MKKYSYQNFEEKAIDYSHISKSLQYAESPKLKKVVSEKVVYQNYNP